MSQPTADPADTALEKANAALVAAIDSQAPGSEAAYLARLALLLLQELQCSSRALELIEVARRT